MHKQSRANGERLAITCPHLSNENMHDQIFLAIDLLRTVSLALRNGFEASENNNLNIAGTVDVSLDLIHQVYEGIDKIENGSDCAVVVSSGSPDVQHDPLVKTIQAFKVGTKAFGDIKEHDWPMHGGEEAVVEKTFGQPLEALKKWSHPAVTRHGALEALRFAYEESQVFGVKDTVTAMIYAALSYFENEVAGSHSAH